MRFLTILSSAALALTLSACDPTTGIDPVKVENAAPSVTLSSTSYRAADALISQITKTIDATTPMLVGTLNDVNKLETSTPLGRMIAEQISGRFVQRGFVVSDVRFRSAINVKEDNETGSTKENGEFFLSRDTAVIKGEQDVGVVITGTYAIGGRDVQVNVRLINAADSRVLAATDYKLPITEDVKALIKDDGASTAPQMFTLGWN